MDQRLRPRSLQPICPRNACQGTSPPSRRQLTLLQGPSRGEEASKKLLAIGSAEKAKPRRPQGSRTKACLDQGTARAHRQHSMQRSCRLPLTCLTGLISIARGSAVAAAQTSPPAPAKLLSRCAVEQGAQVPLPAAPRLKQLRRPLTPPQASTLKVCCCRSATRSATCRPNCPRLTGERAPAPHKTDRNIYAAHGAAVATPTAISPALAALLAQIAAPRPVHCR